jgi:hypothetical protein
MSTLPRNMKTWDCLLLKVLIRYRGGVQASTRYSPFMILTNWTSRLKVNNHLNMFTHTFDEEQNFKQIIEHMIARWNSLLDSTWLYWGTMNKHKFNRRKHTC